MLSICPYWKHYTSIKWESGCIEISSWTVLAALFQSTPWAGHLCCSISPRRITFFSSNILKFRSFLFNRSSPALPRTLCEIAWAVTGLTCLHKKLFVCWFLICFLPELFTLFAFNASWFAKLFCYSRVLCHLLCCIFITDTLGNLDLLHLCWFFIAADHC